MCKESKCTDCEETSDNRFWIIVILMVLIYWSLDNYYTEQTKQVQSNNSVKLQELELKKLQDINNNLNYLKQMEVK